MTVTRRTLLAFGGGAAAGIVFTPVPWKLLDDTSIWTQNWPWIPQPAHALVTVKQTSCTLCPKGCGMRVRVAAGSPVGVAGSPGHPVSDGALCPLAFGAHQLNWHPRRLRQVKHAGRTASWEETRAAFRKACAEGAVAVVDGRPGRAASLALKSFAKKSGSYHVVASREDAALAPYASWSGFPAGALGYDLASARTILSFGAPLLDGCGMPGRLIKRWSRREVKIIQVEAAFSRTAASAAQWVAIRPGSEGALAAGLARVIGKGPMPEMSLQQAAHEAGVTVEAIQELARTIASEGPALAISADAQPAVAALNLAMGGGVVRRSDTAENPVPLGTSYRAILVDGSVPWEFEPKASGEVFRFAAWDAGDSKADWLLPAAGFLEELTDIPSAPASAVSTYAISPALFPPAHTVSSAMEFVEGSVEDAIKARVEQIQKSGNGKLHRPGETEAVALKDIKLHDELLAGAVWVDDPKRLAPVHCDLKAWPQQAANPKSGSWAAGWGPPVLPPLSAKLFQESNLRERPTRSQI